MVTAHSIDIVADLRSGEFFEHCPDRGETLYKNKRAAWRGVPALLGQLRVNFYDVVVDLRSDGLAYLLHARRRHTKWGARAARGPHAVQRLMAIVEGLLGLAEIPPQRIWVNEAAREFARRVLADLPGRRWLALGPGAKWPKKVWPAQRFIDMAKAVEDRFDGVIVLAAAATESAVIHAASAATSTGRPEFSSTGSTVAVSAAPLTGSATLQSFHDCYLAFALRTTYILQRCECLTLGAGWCNAPSPVLRGRWGRIGNPRFPPLLSKYQFLILQDLTPCRRAIGF